MNHFTKKIRECMGYDEARQIMLYCFKRSLLMGSDAQLWAMLRKVKEKHGYTETWLNVVWDYCMGLTRQYEDINRL